MTSTVLRIDWVTLVTLVIIVSVCTLFCTILGSFITDKIFNGGIENIFSRGRKRRKRHRRFCDRCNHDNDLRVEFRNRNETANVVFNGGTDEVNDEADNEVVAGGTFDRLGIRGSRTGRHLLMPYAKQLEDQELSPIQQTPPVNRRLGFQLGGSTSVSNGFFGNNLKFSSSGSNFKRTMSQPSKTKGTDSSDSVFMSHRNVMTPSPAATDTESSDPNPMARSAVRVLQREPISGRIRSLTPDNALNAKRDDADESIATASTARPKDDVLIEVEKEPGTPGNTIPQKNFPKFELNFARPIPITTAMTADKNLERRLETNLATHSADPVLMTSTMNKGLMTKDVDDAPASLKTIDLSNEIDSSKNFSQTMELTALNKNLNIGEACSCICARCGFEHECEKGIAPNRRKRCASATATTVRQIKRRSTSKTRSKESLLCQGDDCDVVGCGCKNDSAMFRLGQRKTSARKSIQFTYNGNAKVSKGKDVEDVSNRNPFNL